MAFREFTNLHDNRQSDAIPYFSFYDLSGNLIIGDITATFTDDGQFDAITCEKDGMTVTYNNGQFSYTTACLYVLGIGFLIPGDIVKLKIDSCKVYELNFGWHTNVSNQTIYSWYLKPIKIEDYFKDERKGLFNESDPNITNTGILTFYKEYLSTIEVVEFVKDRNYFNTI